MGKDSKFICPKKKIGFASNKYPKSQNSVINCFQKFKYCTIIKREGDAKNINTSQLFITSVHTDERLYTDTQPEKHYLINIGSTADNKQCRLIPKNWCGQCNDMQRMKSVKNQISISLYFLKFHHKLILPQWLQLGHEMQKQVPSWFRHKHVLASDIRWYRSPSGTSEP